MAAYHKFERLYEGKTKELYATDDPQVLIIDYTDNITALNGQKRGVVAGKGTVNNRVTNHLMRLLAGRGIPTQYIEQLSDRQTAVRRLEMVPLKVIVRNVAAGSMARRYGIEEGLVLVQPVVELVLKDDRLNDPMLGDDHALAIGLTNAQELALLRSRALEINAFLLGYCKERGLDLIDLRLEFGHRPDDVLTLADELSPDTCRFWDSVTGEKLDRDRFSHDLGNVEEAYHEILRRLIGE